MIPDSCLCHISANYFYSGPIAQRRNLPSTYTTPCHHTSVFYLRSIFALLASDIESTESSGFIIDHNKGINVYDGNTPSRIYVTVID
jgi:hypothetical protein